MRGPGHIHVPRPGTWEYDAYKPKGLCRCDWMEKLWNKNYSGSPECALSRLKGPYTVKREAEESKSEMESLERVVSAFKAGRVLKRRDAKAWRKKRAWNRSPYMPFQRNRAKPTFWLAPRRCTLAFWSLGLKENEFVVLKPIVLLQYSCKNNFRKTHCHYRESREVIRQCPCLARRGYCCESAKPCNFRHRGSFSWTIQTSALLNTSRYQWWDLLKSGHLE